MNRPGPFFFGRAFPFFGRASVYRIRPGADPGRGEFAGRFGRRGEAERVYCGVFRLRNGLVGTRTDAGAEVGRPVFLRGPRDGAEPGIY